MSARNLFDSFPDATEILPLRSDLPTPSGTRAFPIASAKPFAMTLPTFAELYETYFSFVWRTARRLGVREPGIDDVVQEIFLIVHRKLDTFEGRSSLKTWLFGITLHVARRQLRQTRMQLVRETHEPSESAPELPSTDRSIDPHENVANAQAAQFLQGFLDGMDDDKRVVFILAELEQVPITEIAKLLSIATNTTYSRLRLAREEFERAASRYRASDEWRLR